MRPTRSIAVVASCFVAACTSTGAHGEIGIYPPDAGEFGAVVDPIRPDGSTLAPETIVAAIHSSSGLTLCPDQCTTLTAEASVGTAPYAFTWTNGLDDGPGPHEVCPTEPTTYTVSARDASSGEFMHGAGMSSITITPTADCRKPSATLCSARFTLSEEARDAFHPVVWPMIANDAAGNVFVTSSFHGTTAIGARSNTAVGRLDGFVAKLDASCALVWIKQYGSPTSNVVMNDIDVDAAGHLYITGTFTGGLDLGAGMWTSAAGDAFVARLDADGNTQWARHFSTAVARRPLDPPSLHVTSTGEVLLSGTAPADVDFGGGQLSASNATILVTGLSTPNLGFVVGLAADTGAHHFTHALSGFSAVTSDATGTPVLIGQPYLELQGDAIRNPVGLTLTRYAADSYSVADLGAGLGGDSNIYYQNVRHDDFDIELNRTLGRRIAYAARGPAFLVNMYQAIVQVDWEDPLLSWVARAAFGGMPLWSPVRTELTGVYASGVAIDSQDRAVLVGDFAQSASLTDQTLSAVGGRDLFILTLDPNGNRVSARHLEDELAQWLSYVSIDSDDNVWVAGFSNDGLTLDTNNAQPTLVATPSREVFVHKFAP